MKDRIMLVFSILAGVVLLVVLFFVFSSPVTTPDVESKYLESIELGGEWFLSNQNDEFLYYEYDPFNSSYSEKQHSLREMGALWSIGRLSNFLDDSRYDDLAKKGFKYFEPSLKYDEEFDFQYVNLDPRKIKLGYSAFMVLSLIEIDHPYKEEYLIKLANGIIHQQQGDGSLQTYFYSDQDTGVDYYPGEALTALMNLYEYTKDEAYLEVLDKAFPYYSKYWKKNPNTAFAPWQSRAYTKFYNVTERKEIADFVFDMNDFILEEHSVKGNCSNFIFPNNIATAVYMEGVNKAYEIAENIGDEERALCYANFIKEGSDYIISLQVTDASSFEKAAIGGFLGGPSSNSMRVDRNQHAVMALMDAHELGLLE